MNHRLAIRIAWRYIFSRKSHSAVNAISIVAVCGVAVATLVIVCVLSVFNGFQETLESRFSQVSPDLLVQPARGAVIADGDSMAVAVNALDGVKRATPIVADNALLYRNANQLPVRILGVRPDEFAEVTGAPGLLIKGSKYQFTDEIADSSDSSQPMPIEVNADEIAETASEQFDESALFADVDDLYDDSFFEQDKRTNYALVSVGIPMRLGLDENNVSQWEADGITLFVPRRTSKVNMANPATSFRVDSLGVSGVIVAEQAEFDNNTVVVDIDIARRLFEYTSESTAIYVSLTPGADARHIAKEIEKISGGKCVVLDRNQQESEGFKMLSIEKWITFMLLSFILLIASFNIISTLSMFILEKRQSILLMSHLGGSKAFVSRIFSWESFIICMIGSVAGIVAGVILCLLQQYFGFIKLGGDTSRMIIDVYPVRVMVSDLLLVLLPSLGVGALTALVSSRYARTMIEN